MRNRINEIWDELANDSHTSLQGIIIRRFSAKVLPDIYIAIQKPESLLAVCVSLDRDVEVSLSDISKFKEIKVKYEKSPISISKKILIILLLNLNHKDIFAALCEDLIKSVKDELNQKIQVKIILNRLEKWKSLFDKINPSGLSGEKQRGLYGELYLLRKLLSIKKSKYYDIINSWGGSEMKVQDFQSKQWAVEVKTSRGKNHQKVYINNELQLDNSNIEDLFLYHISLDVIQKSGESLNEIVDEIKKILKNHMTALNSFNDKLFEAEYYYFQQNLYDNVGYNIRDDNFYRVLDDFPRIQENDIMEGVGDVKYSIILSQCKSFISRSKEVFCKITFDD